MLLNVCHKKRYGNKRSVFDTTVALGIFCLIFYIRGVTSLARVDNNWSHRRPNATVAQNQWGQPGYRPAGGVAYQQPYAYNRNNQTLGHQQWHLNNNRSTQYQQPIAPVPTRPNQNPSNWNQSNYNSPRTTFNQTRPVWGQQPPYVAHAQGAFNQNRPTSSQPSAYPANGQASYNQTRPVWPQTSGTLNQTRPVWGQQTPYPAYGQSAVNQTRPVWPQPSVPKIPNQTPYAANSQGSFNQSRPAGSQPTAFYTPQNPSYGQGSFNQSNPTWSQPSALLLPNNSHNPASSKSNLYPILPNNPNSKPAFPANSWSPPANQTLLYPQLPNQNMPQPLPVGNNNGIPLAPLQPQTNPQGPHNWQSGGQSALSYGPGYYPPPAANSNKTPPIRQGSSNPYSNMFI